MNTNTGEIRPLMSRDDLNTRLQLKEHEMLLPIEGPLSEKKLHDKTPLDRLRILHAQQKRARRRARNLRVPA